MSDLLAKKDELDALDATDVGADPAGTAATAVSDHSVDTTAVHGIADTSALVLTGDSRLSDARTPTAHATSHQDGGADELALDGSQITAGTVADARIASTIARDSEVAAGYQPLDTDLTTLAGLTATTDNMIQSVGSAWASRTPVQVKAALAITTADVSTLDTSLGSLNTQAAIAAARQAALLNANAGYYIGAGLDYTASATAGKMDRTSGVGLFGPVEGTGGTSATAVGSTVATLGAALTAGQEMWVTFEIGSTGTTFQNAGTAAAAGSAAIPDTTAGRVVVGWLYIEFASVALNAVDELLTTPNDKAKFIDARVVRLGPSVTGWCYDQNTPAFVSSTTGAGGGLITYKYVGVDTTGYITPGTKVAFDDGTNTPLFGMVATSTFSTDTTVTLIKQSDYVMANATVKYSRYSRADCPVGFPPFFNWLPTLSGWSSDPTNAAYTWYPSGPRSLNLAVRQLTAGTSNSATHNMTLPVAARTLTNGVWAGAGTGIDNGSAIQAGTLVIVSAATTCGLNGLITNTSTASGSSRFGAGQIQYPY